MPTLIDQVNAAVEEARDSAAWSGYIALGLKPLAIAVAGVAGELSSGFTEVAKPLERIGVNLGDLGKIAESLGDVEAALATPTRDAE